MGAVQGERRVEPLEMIKKYNNFLLKNYLILKDFNYIFAIILLYEINNYKE